jgi:Na+-driven multidrug efflux pump
MRTILPFWIPLLLTWLMMAVEQPYLSALIARLPDPKYNLAAFGIAFSLALVLEAPVIMMMSAVIALVKGKASFCQLRRFMHQMNLVVFLITILLLIPQFFHWFGTHLLALNQDMVSRTYRALWFLLPWAPAIGYRRFYHGLLIQAHLTRRVTFSTIARMVTMGVAALLAFQWMPQHGASVGALALSCGVVVEAMVARWLAKGTRRTFFVDDQREGHHKIYVKGEIFAFYWPLILTTFISLSARPVVVFFLGHASMALDSLAVVPVINALLFIFSAIGLSFQEVGVALAGDHLEQRKTLQRFALIVGSLMSFVYFFLTATPLAHWWFGRVSGLSEELTQFALGPALTLVLIPFSSIALSYQRAMLVKAGLTRWISRASYLEVAVMVGWLLLLVFFWNAVGAYAFALSLTAGRLASLLFLTWGPPWRTMGG